MDGAIQVCNSLLLEKTWIGGRAEAVDELNSNSFVREDDEKKNKTGIEV